MESPHIKKERHKLDNGEGKHSTKSESRKRQSKLKRVKHEESSDEDDKPLKSEFPKSVPLEWEIPPTEFIEVGSNCRLCLKKISSNSTPIWGEFSIAKKILQCCSFEVLETDKLKMLCSRCATRLESVHKFRQKCLKSNEIFKKFNENMINEEDLPKAIVKSEPEIIMAEPEPADDNDHHDYEDEMEFDSKEKIYDEKIPDKNKNIEDSDEEGEFPCEKCPMICLGKKEYKNHKGSHSWRVKKQLADMKPRKKTPLVETALMCYYCGKMFDNRNKARVHIISHKNMVPLPEPLTCEECGRLYINLAKLRYHQMMVHNKVTSYTCNICGNQLKTKNSLRYHMKCVHLNRDKNACQYCDKKFGNTSNLQTHMRTHTGEKPFACPDCDRAFCHRAAMKQHRLKVHNINMFDRPAEKVLSKKSKKSATAIDKAKRVSLP